MGRRGKASDFSRDSSKKEREGPPQATKAEEVEV